MKGEALIERSYGRCGVQRKGATLNFVTFFLENIFHVSIFSPLGSIIERSRGKSVYSFYLTSLSSFSPVTHDHS